MSTINSNVLCLPQNRVGRDFVVGDTGGAYDLLLQSMRSAGFEPSRDRIFSVGHLLAGECSLTDCIRFLRMPSVFAVRTNSEQDLLDLFSDGPPDEESIRTLNELPFHDMGWLTKVGYQQRMQLVSAMRMLPVAISIGNGVVRTGFVHESVPEGKAWGDFLGGLQEDAENCLMAAMRGIGGSAMIVEGVERMFVCYTPDWAGTKRPANAVAVAPGSALYLVEEMGT